MQSISHKSYIIFFYFIHFKLFQLPLNIDNKFGIEFTRIKIRKVIGEFEKGRYLKEKMITMQQTKKRRGGGKNERKSKTQWNEKQESRETRKGLAKAVIEGSDESGNEQDQSR